MVVLSQAISSMARSGIREIFDLARSIEGVIHLELGEPDFETADHICEAADVAARSGFTRYTPNAGIPELREALTEKVKIRNGVSVDTDQVIVTPGGGAALFTTLLALTDPGDEVLLSDPGWPNYRMMVQTQGLKPVYFPLSPEDGWVYRPEIIERHITDQTKALVVNSPGNPTGALIPENILDELVQLARHYDLWIVSDEVYDEIVFRGTAVAMAIFDTDGRVVTVYSFSKTYAMTGWRVGYATAPPEAAGAIVKCQEPVTSCVNAPAQMAALAALEGPQDVVTQMRESYRERKDAVAELLTDGDIPVVEPSGAFYIWADISRSGMSDMDYAMRLVRERHVAVVPGTTFGPRSSSYVRLSLAAAQDELLEGVEHLVESVNAWGS